MRVVYPSAHRISQMESPNDMLPLSPPVYHILLALGTEAMHGYGMMEAIDAKTGSEDVLLPGTLYATLQRMLDQGMVEALLTPPDPEADRRRRYYRTTEFGRQVAAAESARMRRLLTVARDQGLLAEEG